MSNSGYTDVLLYIDGAWRPASDGRKTPVIDPATEEVVGHFAHAHKADLDDALAASERGFALWSRTPSFERYQIMRRAADLLRERRQHIARLMTIEGGKPLGEALFEVSAGADMIDWLAEEGRRLYGRMVPARSPDTRQMVIREPIGPVAAFTPWNFPISQALRKVAAALAAGCSIILKGPEETPASPAELIRAFADAGIPAGVVGLVFGTPGEIADHLVPHPIVRKISFTGSTAVGKQLASQAALHMKRTTMELGGHASVLVLRDANLDIAAAASSGMKFLNAGQVCSAPTRFLVEEPVYEEFVSKFVEAIRSIVVGNGLDGKTTMGPLTHDRRLSAIEALVGDATGKGARLRSGGRRIGNKGYFFEPTLLTEVPLDARAMNEEPFGPVALISPMRDLESMLTEANRLRYGLATYAFTEAERNAQEIGRRIRSGIVAINHGDIAFPEVPFGGVDDSGYGSEGGTEALESYVTTKLITHRLLPVAG